MEHKFIFTPGLWLGEGKVSFSASPETLQFYTRWEALESIDNGYPCVQTVEMQGIDEHVRNSYLFTMKEPGKFEVVLQSDLQQRTIGSGVVSPQEIAWEFRGHDHFEGYEVYQLQEDGSYTLHAEYSSPEQFRTIINGRVWKKQT